MGNHIMDEVLEYITSKKINDWRNFYDGGSLQLPTSDYARMFSQIEPDAIIKHIDTDEKSSDQHNHIGNYKIKLKNDGRIVNDFEFLKIKFLKLARP